MLCSGCVCDSPRGINRGGSGMQQIGFCHDASIIADGTGAAAFGQAVCSNANLTPLYLELRLADEMLDGGI